MINYNPKDRQKALEFASRLNFEDIEITDKHMETSLMLFMDDNNGTWTIDGTCYGRYKLSYDGERIATIDKCLEDLLDIFVEEYRNADEKKQHDEEEYREHQNEMLRNTNRNNF